jgi:hypothetical protein
MNQTSTQLTPHASELLQNLEEPVLTDLETVLRHSAYQSLQPVTRPDYWGVDLDPAQRPGTPKMRPDPHPFPNTRFPPQRQAGEPAAPMHGRPNKVMPPVFGTAVPLSGLSGVIRRLAYRLPDHRPSHWLLMLIGDRVEALTHRTWRYLPVAVPFAAMAALVRAGRLNQRELKRSILAKRIARLFKK